MAHNILSAYPDFNEKIEMHTDARKFLSGAVMIQEVKPIVFYNRKLTSPQTRYTVTSKELPRIIKNLKEF